MSRRPPTATEIRRATDAGRVRMLDVALRELERADKAEAKAGKVFDKTGTRRSAVAFSRAGKKVDDWASVVDRITKRFAQDVIAAERREQRRRVERMPKPLRTEIKKAQRTLDRLERLVDDEIPDDFDAEWEFACEYIAGEASSNVDINFRLRRDDGRPFGKPEAERAMRTFRAQLSAGVNTAPPGYRIAGIDWRRPSKRQTGWTKHGQFPRDLGGLEAVLYVGSDHPSIWSVTDKPKFRLGSVDD